MDIDDVNQKFEQLAQLEKEFETVDLEILRITTQKQADLFNKRDAVTDSIEGFWPHVLEEASGHVGMDEFVAAEDMVALTAVTGLKVTRPDVESGDPRNLEISWTFKDNDYMPAQTIVKKFTFQGSNTPGLTGLISEPVDIKWKDGKDLTNGINKAAIEAFEERKAKAAEKKEGKGKKAAKLGPKEQKLLDIIPNASSFFTWFSFSGSHAGLGEVNGDDEESGAEDEDEEMQGPVEPFPYADELAVQFAEEVYPAAVKHFTNSLEEDSDDNSDDESVDIDSDVEEQFMKTMASSSNSSKLKRSGADEDGPEKKKAKN